ncbi:protein IQ-DOMAIN 14-like [Panicum virgatum]|uniref:protein IQ-DOMAIN 14-like n=1 Tax=Panicum virgatum TaxID=38727 RepID=UPI0019D5A0D5|nr:protein IQ-DOMAIN 14-like [Panicum virgatum]
MHGGGTLTGSQLCPASEAKYSPRQNPTCVFQKKNPTCLQIAIGSGGRRCPPEEGIPKAKLNPRGSIFPRVALPRAVKLALRLSLETPTPAGSRCFPRAGDPRGIPPRAAFPLRLEAHRAGELHPTPAISPGPLLPSLVFSPHRCGSPLPPSPRPPPPRRVLVASVATASTRLSAVTFRPEENLCFSIHSPSLAAEVALGTVPRVPCFQSLRLRKLEGWPSSRRHRQGCTMAAICRIWRKQHMIREK